MSKCIFSDVKLANVACKQSIFGTGFMKPRKMHFRKGNLFTRFKNNKLDAVVVSYYDQFGTKTN